MVVEDFQTAETEASAPAIEVHLHSVVIDRNHPEHVVAVNVHVVIMNLRRDGENRSNWSGV